MIINVFLWCHVRHINCEGRDLWRISRKGKKIAENLNYDGIDFPVGKKDYSKISMMNKININVFSYENKNVYPAYLSDQRLDKVLDLLLVNNHYVLIKDFNRLMFNKNKCKNKKWFCKSCLQCFSSMVKIVCQLMVLIKLEREFIEFNNFNKMIPAPFKIYEIDMGIHNDCFSYTAKYQDHVPCSFAYKLVCVHDKYSKDVVLYRGKNAVYKFIQSIFKEHDYCRSVMKKHFNKNLVMTTEEEEFEKSEIYWLCGKIIDDNKVRDHCHITSKHGGTTHWSCNINVKVSKKLVVIFHNSKGYDSHSIFKELSKFNFSADVIPNGLKKYMSFTLNKNIVFIDSMLFMNSSLDKLVKNLNDFKYLSSVFKEEQSELVKQKGIYLYEYMNSFKRFKEDCLPDKDCILIL